MAGLYCTAMLEIEGVLPVMTRAWCNGLFIDSACAWHVEGGGGVSTYAFGVEGRGEDEIARVVCARAFALALALSRFALAPSARPREGSASRRMYEMARWRRLSSTRRPGVVVQKARWVKGKNLPMMFPSK